MRTAGILETTIGPDERPVNIAYTDSNIGRGGVALVYLHEWGCSREDFERAADYPDLAGRRQITFDFPGHGGSDYPAKGEVGVGNLVEITHDLVNVAGLGWYALVGHGVGGLVAVRYDMKYRWQASGLVNIAGNMTADDCRMAGEIARGVDTKAALAERFKRSDSYGSRRYGQRLGGVRERAFVDLAASVVRECKTGSPLNGFTDSELPRLFMYGELASRKPRYLQKLRRHHVSIRVVPGAGHFPADDNPDFFYTALGTFMRRLDVHYGLAGD